MMNNRLNEVNIAQAKTLILAMIEQAQTTQEQAINILLHGSPGMAKSAIIAEAAKEKEAEFIDLRIGNMDASDILGIPHVVDGEMRFSTPTWFPEHDKLTVLLLDELGNANIASQHAAYQLVHDRTITNGKKLSNNVIIIGATNLKSDKTGARDLVPAFNNRFGLHLTIKNCIETALVYMMGQKYHSGIIGFIDWKKDALSQKPTAGEATFATPRTWSMVDKHMKNPALTESLLDVAIAGAVGTPLAIEFAAYREVFGSLPDWKRIRSGDGAYKFDYPHNDPHLEHAISTALALELLDSLENDQQEDFMNLTAFLSNVSQELKIVTFKTLSRRRDILVKGLKTPEFLKEYRDISNRV